jgi:hypothetical protein
MRKRIIKGQEREAALPEGDWMDLEQLAAVEVTSEAPGHPVEGALLPEREEGWRAGAPGPQTIRLVFDTPQPIHRIRLGFEEPHTPRTQEFILRWAPSDQPAMEEIMRQQWNFDPAGSTEENEDYEVGLTGVGVLELRIVPDISGGKARASLAELRLA